MPHSVKEMVSGLAESFIFGIFFKVRQDDFQVYEENQFNPTEFAFIRSLFIMLRWFSWKLTNGQTLSAG